MRESIRIFDENLLAKVNKGTFEFYKTEANDKFMKYSQLTKIDEAILLAQQKLKDFDKGSEEAIESYKQKLVELVETTTDEVLASKFK